MRTDRALWERFRASPLGDIDAALSFTHRLSRDNGWSLEFATRAVDEYRRFVYLACVSPNEVTPSDEVDQVWHLHLAYSQHYWDEFCPNVLQRKLHHGPTKGGASEDARFEQQYDNTLALYAYEFGTEPPPDLWPPREIRFGLAPFYRRVNLDRDSVLPRTSVVAQKVIALGAIGLSFAVAAGGSGLLGQAGQIVALSAISIFGFFAVLGLTQPIRPPAADNKRDSNGCSGYYYSFGDSDGGGDGGDGGCGGGGCGACGG